MSEDSRGFFFYQPMIVRRTRRRKKRKRTPSWTFMLITTCVLIFFLEYLVPLSREFAFKPIDAISEPWVWVTSIFLHADFNHLLFNMIALFMFGNYLESRVNERQFLTIFIAAGLFGNLAYYLTNPLGTISALGASGAVYGIMGMLAILYPGLVVYFFGFAPVPMIFAAFLWFVMEFSGMFTPSNIAHQAHLAGLVAGMVYGLYVRRTKRKYQFFWEK
jgi:membrane associated rhomboid family serine protease